MRTFRWRGNPLSVVGACAIGLSLSACSFAGLEPFDDEGAVRGASRSVGLSPKPVQAPGFVEGSRAKELEYVPVGVTPPARLPLGNRAQIEAELNAKRAVNEARAAAPRPSSPFDGKVEPGYRPPPPAPIPPGPNVAAPRQPSSDAKASIRDRTINASKKRAQESAEGAPKQ